MYLMDQVLDEAEARLRANWTNDVCSVLLTEDIAAGVLPGPWDESFVEILMKEDPTLLVRNDYADSVYETLIENVETVVLAHLDDVVEELQNG